MRVANISTLTLLRNWTLGRTWPQKLSHKVRIVQHHRRRRQSISSTNMGQSNRNVHHRSTYSPSRTDFSFPRIFNLRKALLWYATIWKFHYSAETREKAQGACFSPLKALWCPQTNPQCMFAGAYGDSCMTIFILFDNWEICSPFLKLGG